MKKLIYLIVGVVVLSADINIMDALKHHRIGSNTERVVLGGDTEQDSSINRAPTRKSTYKPIQRVNDNPKLQECYKRVEGMVQRAYKSNKNNDPTTNISIVALNGSKKCADEHKECAERAWQAGHRCFQAQHPGLTPEQVNLKCNTLSSSGTIKCALQETACSNTALHQKCDRDYGSIPVTIKPVKPIEPVTPIKPPTPVAPPPTDQDIQHTEYIKMYQNDIETTKHTIDRLEERLRAEREYGVQDRYHQRRIEQYREKLKAYRHQLQIQKQQLQTLGGKEKSHTKRDNNDIYSDIRKNQDIYDERQKQKLKQQLIKRAHYIVDRYGEDYDQQRLTHARIEELSENADIASLQNIIGAVKKQYYDAMEIKLQGDAEYQTNRADEIGNKGKYVNTLKDTSLTANKIIARFDPTGTGDKIVNTMEHTYAAIDGYEKDGVQGAIVKTMDIHTNGIASDTVDTAKEYRDYHSTGLKLNPDEIYYDKDGNRVSSIKSGDITYATPLGDRGKMKLFSLSSRVGQKTINKLDEIYNPQTQVNNTIKTIKEGIQEGDINKIANGTMDAMDIKDEWGSGDESEE